MSGESGSGPIGGSCFQPRLICAPGAGVSPQATEGWGRAFLSCPRCARRSLRELLAVDHVLPSLPGARPHNSRATSSAPAHTRALRPRRSPLAATHLSGLHVRMPDYSRTPPNHSPTGPDQCTVRLGSDAGLRSNADHLDFVSPSAPRALSAARGLRPALWLQGQKERPVLRNKPAMAARPEVSFGSEKGDFPRAVSQAPLLASRAVPEWSTQPFLSEPRRFLVAVSCSRRSCARDRRSASAARSRTLFARRTIWLYSFRSPLPSRTLPSSRVCEDVALWRAGRLGTTSLSADYRARAGRLEGEPTAKPDGIVAATGSTAAASPKRLGPGGRAAQRISRCWSRGSTGTQSPPC